MDEDNSGVVTLGLAQVLKQKYLSHGLMMIKMMTKGRIQDFKLGGGGGAHLKKLRRAEGGAKIFGVFRVKIHDFTPIKQITESPSYH